jgi:RNA polymerase sigma-70 factor (ECF subfamily)
MDKQNLEQIYEENVSAVYKYLFCLTHDYTTAERTGDSTTNFIEWVNECLNQ